MDKNQITVRVTDRLDKKILRAAEARGLSKASWIRQLVIETLESAACEKN